MPQVDQMPVVLAEKRTADGVAFQLRRDPRGVLDVPGLENTLVAVHIGAPAKLRCRRDGTRFSGTAVHGDIDIIPAHTPSHWEMQDENDAALLVSLPLGMLRAVAEDAGLSRERVEVRNKFQIRDAELEALCWAAKREMELRYPSGRLYLDGLALAFASRVVAQHSSFGELANTRNPQRTGELRGRRLKQVLAFIEEQLSEDLSLERIAAAAGISASHVKTLFRNAMGIPVHQYVIQRRVERAKTLLIEDRLTITEIALAAGFAHQSHMARHMRRVLGMPPRAMKRLLAESPAAD